jgi:predicted branched-subunit amino acid permease
MAVFGVAFGAAAAQKGLSLFEATLMSALVFGGAAQFVAIELWTKPMTYTAIVAIAVITASVNMRFLLMSASLRPWLGALPASQTYPALAILNDPGWLLAMRYRSEGGANAATFLASNAALWLIWIGATAPGHAVGALVDDPKRLGLDVVMPCFFVVMLVPLWRGLRWAIPWTVSGGIALLTFAAVPGWWFMIAGAVAGSLTAGFLDDEG